MVSISKRTSMALFSDPNDHYCQRVRIVLEEKGISSEIIDSDKNNLGDVCLYDSVTLMEYLDERFPHPPLLPVYPVSRANIRLYIQRIENDWCSIFDRLNDEKLKAAEEKKLKKQLKSQIAGANPIFKEKPYFMNEEFSLVDCCIAPILWRLPQVGIEIPADAKNKPINEYMKRVFTREAFINSLSEIEREIRSL